ncbi:MAG: site-specific DNA-methyltransferase [Candidatus Rokuibacteriota bacterium]
MRRRRGATGKGAVAKKTADAKRKIENYTHRKKKRMNNPPVGLVTPDTDRDAGKKSYAYDPHLDPSLQWAGKAERTSFEVPTVSLHVHERIDSRSVIDAVRKRNGEDFVQGSLFSQLEENLPLREAVDFYKHKHNWSNRLIAGDSLLVMNSLLEKEGMAGKVQAVYIDPPYGIKYGSNFQPFVNKRDVKDGKDEDLTAEPEMVKAFRDTWELGIHSYLTYLRDRLLLAKELLHESGSVFVQISDENVHLIRAVMDEVFGAKNFAALISFSKAAGGLRAANRVGVITDYLVWYFRDEAKAKYRPLYERKTNLTEAGYTWIELESGKRRPMTAEERRGAAPLPPHSRPFGSVLMTKPGPGAKFEVLYEGQKYEPGRRWWGTTPEGIQNIIRARRIVATENSIRFVTYFDDFPYRAFTNVWVGFGGAADPVYVVQTNSEIVARCLLMTSDPGDLVVDITCGSGTTAYVAEQWGRRWITCDTSRVAITLAKQRLMTSIFPYYELAHPTEGVDSGFVYRTVPHISMKTVATTPDIKEGMTREQIERAIQRHADQETLYNEPLETPGRVRVTGPFTVEAVPAPAVRSLHDVQQRAELADNSIARSGETLRQSDWRDELLKTGIRGKGGQRIQFSRVELLPATRWLHADAETKDEKPQRVVVSFGPDHAPLEQRQVELALAEAETLRPKPKMIVFAAFQFDPEASKDIDETNWPGVTLLKAQMNADLLTEDLKKKRASNESFWLIGHPDVEIEKISKGDDKGKYRVTVNGFDYYNTVTGEIDSGGSDKIAVWMLDPDYDGRSLFPRQVFFPMAGDGEGWTKLAKNLRAEIDEDLIEAYRGVTSLPFGRGKHQRAAVKIVDARGIESLKLIDLE